MADWYDYRIRFLGHIRRLASIIFALLALAYSLSRVYLVVESFISLRHAPIGAYAAVPWVEAVPHI